MSNAIKTAFTRNSLTAISGMNRKEQKIIDILIAKGEELLKRPFEPLKFTKNEEADKILNSLNEIPHAFVLASVMDRQIRAERAWLIP